MQPNVHVTNEPIKVAECENPDFVITKDQIPIGFIEAKDIGKDLNHKQYKEQQLGRIWINDQQYFDKIPLVTWNFYIGAYRPAQK